MSICFRWVIWLCVKHGLSLHEYAGFAPEAFEKLKDKAIVVVAGNPESRPELEAKGLLNYIHVKNNVLEELKGYQVKLGIK